MSTPDSAQPLVLIPAVPRPSAVLSRLSIAVSEAPAALVAAMGAVVILTVAFFAGRILAVSLSYDFFVDSTPIATALGSISFLSIVLISIALVVGHQGLRSVHGSRALVRQAAAIAVGAAYLHLILWATRVIAAALAASSSGSSGLFLSNVFWWG